MPPDEPNDEERLEELPEDNETPFQPAAQRAGAPTVDDTHPDTDTDIDKQELYDAGKAAAASGADEPHDDTTVVNYEDPKEKNEKSG